MLDISKISHTVTHSEEWRKQRNGKMTASKNGLLIGEKSNLGIFTKTAITYIEGLAGEAVTGEPMEKEFFNTNTDWGNAHEPESLTFFSKTIGRPLLRNEEDGTTHRLIIQNEYEAATPDALCPVNADLNKLFDGTGTKINVDTVEGKCPAKHHRFIKLFKLNTPADLKKVESNYYWQVVSQMLYCDALNGYFYCYHPNFGGSPKIKIIHFRKLDMVSEFKFLSETLKYAKDELLKTIQIFK